MKQIRLTFILFASCLLFSCSKTKEIKMSVNIESDYHQLNEKTSDITIFFKEQSSSKIQYKNLNAINYARKYAGVNNNSCGIYNNNSSANLSDCAHFIAHCLKDGGIEIKAAAPNLSICKDGLCYRVVELTTALEKLSQTYSNVQKIDIDDAIVGDFCFFKIPMVRPTHAFMICQPAANSDDITIYAHTTNRNCEKPEPNWYQFFDVAYRITDAN